MLTCSLYMVFLENVLACSMQYIKKSLQGVKMLKKILITYIIISSTLDSVWGSQDYTHTNSSATEKRRQALVDVTKNGYPWSLPEDLRIEIVLAA